jgi:hypothetical protein
MQPLIKPLEELNKARAAVDDMRRATDLNALNEYWQEFLHRLERSWNKSVSHLKRCPKYQGWVERGHTLGLRKKDPLLSYLRNARGAEEHTVEEIVAREPGIVTISSADGKPIDIEASIQIDEGMSVRKIVTGAASTSAYVLLTKTPGSLTVTADRPVRVDFKAAKLRLLPVVNRGQTYDPPTSHLGQPLNELGPNEAAELGLTFYESYFKRAEEFFCTSR